ncbi:MAG: DNA polymerase I [Candidatus Spechtbacteria bacterium]|nr:DNA polymerase I [Candidatus Spechtbacteria bacterium]
MTSKNKKLFLILDANALIHRSYHALPEFRTHKGVLVNAVYGFTSILLKVLREFEPEYIAAAFDVHAPTFRDVAYEEYKAKRVKAPDELYQQIPYVKEVLNAFHIPIYEKEGFEADDVIGTVAKLAERSQAQPKAEIVIVSGDLDTLQLVDKQTKVYTMRKGLADTVLYDEEAVKKRFGGLTPKQMVDYKGLRGDPSDNIPGVTGVGEKTAIQILSAFDSIDNLYKRLEEKDQDLSQKIKPKLQERLLQYKEQALFSRELAMIRKDVPIDFRLRDLRWAVFKREEVEEVLEKFEFRSLIARLPSFVSAKPKEELRETNEGIGEKKDATFEKIEKLNTEGVFSQEVYELEKKLVSIVRNMEKLGIKIDKEYLEKLAKEIQKDLTDTESRIYEISGKKFNINSPQQLSEILFSHLALPLKGLKKTPGGVVSTAAPELEKLQGAHPVISQLLKYRELQKLYSTYLMPLPSMADAEGRIHTSFDQLGASTGRISSLRPNLQNIPARGEWGTKIRKGFIAGKGFQFVAFDYSQMELRIAAHIADDQKMKAFFRQGEDIHVMTAAEVFGVPKQDVTSEMRYRAKALNFGILYGMGASGFAKSANISRTQAKDFIDGYFARFPAIYEYIQKIKEFTREHGYAETLLHRKRYIPEITSHTPVLKAQAERMAVNHPIQGSSADIIKLAMVAIAESNTLDETCRLILQIHDELLFEIRDDMIEKQSQDIKEIMENAYSLSVPLKVDISFGPSWGELKKLTTAAQ